MRRAAIRFVAGIMLTSGIGLAQAAEDRTTQLSDCSPTERVERLESPEKAPRTTAPGQAQRKQLDHQPDDLACRLFTGGHRHDIIARWWCGRILN
jgi:hypothetical protein